MSHYSVADRLIISSSIKRLIFLIKGREILDLAVEFKVTGRSILFANKD